MKEYLRKVEKTIDTYHKQSVLFSLNQKTALFYALTAFEDICRISGAPELVSTNDRMDYYFIIREQLDALKELIQWIYNDCPKSGNDMLNTSITPEQYLETVRLLKLYAAPYSAICSAYISYSRGHFTASINENNKTITFSDNPSNRKIVISDMTESIMRDQSKGLRIASIQQIPLAKRNLLDSIVFENEHIWYRTDEEIWLPFQRMMEQQWDKASELPEEWTFDVCSISDYKRFWIALATLCMIHMNACLYCGKQGMNLEEAVLVKSPSDFIQLISQKAKITTDTTSAILTLLTYNCQIKNNDIIYQPFVKIDNDKLALAPHLILASRPERNFISLIHKLRDKSYFELTNHREGLMQNEFDNITKYIPNVLIAKNKSLSGDLPDVDYAIWDKESNTILACELKWLIEADSTPEVFARIQDLEHGCNQIEKIISFAKKNCCDFCTKVFGPEYSKSHPEIIGCVVSKNGIRVDNSNTPVITLQTLIGLLSKNSVKETFDIIIQKSYLLSSPPRLEYGLQSVQYAGYTFNIPALKKDQSISIETYRRNDPKIGRNEQCPCGSGKKYKKCCGRL